MTWLDVMLVAGVPPVEHLIHVRDVCWCLAVGARGDAWLAKAFPVPPEPNANDNELHDHGKGANRRPFQQERSGAGRR